RSDGSANLVRDSHRFSYDPPELLINRAVFIGAVVRAASFGAHQQDRGGGEGIKLALKARGRCAERVRELAQVPPAIRRTKCEAENTLPHGRHQGIDRGLLTHSA